MKNGIQETLGKCIKAVIVAESPRAPGRQVFLIFTDDTYFEFYGHEFSGAGGVDPGGIEKVRSYIAMHPEATIKVEHLG